MTPMIEVHLHRASAMDYMVGTRTSHCCAQLGLLQSSQTLTQRHTRLRTRRIYYRICNPVQGSDLLGLDGKVGSIVARMLDCRNDLLMEFVASVASAGGKKRG